MATELPNTENESIMRMAVAWNIVYASNFHVKNYANPDERRKAILNAYLLSYNAILDNEQQRVAALET